MSAQVSTLLLAASVAMVSWSHDMFLGSISIKLSTSWISSSKPWPAGHWGLHSVQTGNALSYT